MLQLLILATSVVPSFADEDADKPARRPQIDRLEQVVDPDKLVRASGVAFGGMQIWCVVYHGQGHYAILNPTEKSWSFSKNVKYQAAIRQVAGKIGSPGGVCFVDGKLWIAGSYGESIGCINTENWKVVRHFKGKQREDKASQSYAGVTHDGEHLWVAWHWYKYDLSAAKTQLLLKMDPETGKVLGEFPIPGGKRRDGAHGLTWDGTNLWHIKDQTLSAIEPAGGNVVARYVLEKLTRPTGLAWDSTTLWITEFSGALWKLPLSNPMSK